MTELVLSKTAEDATTVTLGWVPPAAALGYVFITKDGKRSSTLDGKRSSVKVAKSNLPVTVRAFRTDSEGVYPPPVTPPPPPPPPPPPTGQKVNTNGADNIVVANQTIVVPVEYTDYNIACVYVSGDSKNTRLGPNLHLDGAFLGVKQYGPANGLVIDGVEIAGAGGDATHFDQGVNVRMDNTHIFRPPSQGGEHHDAVQIQAGSGYYFGPGCFFEWPVDYPEITGEKGGSGMFINQSGPFLFDVTIDRVRIWGPKHANALQMMCGGTIISPDIQGPADRKITLDRPHDGRKIVLRSAATGMWANGVKRSDVWCNDTGSDQSYWPDYIQVDP